MRRQDALVFVSEEETALRTIGPAHLLPNEAQGAGGSRGNRPKGHQTERLHRHPPSSQRPPPSDFRLVLRVHPSITVKDVLEMPREASLPSHRSPAAPYARPPPPLPSTSSPGSAPAAQLRSPPPLGSPRDLGGSPRLGVGGVVQPVRPRSSPLPPTLGAGAAGGGSPRMTLRGNDVGPTGNVSLASRPGGSPAPALSPALSTHSPTFHPSPLGLAGSSDHGPTSLASAAAVLMSSRDPLPSIPESPSPRTLDASVPRPSSTAPTSLIAEAMNGVEAAAQNTGPTRSPDYDTADSSHHHTPYASAPGSAARSSASSTPQPVMQTKTPTQTSTIPPQSVAVPQTPAHVQRQCTPMQVVPTAGAGPAPTAGPGQGSASAKKPGACAECRRLKLGVSPGPGHACIHSGFRALIQRDSATHSAIGSGRAHHVKGEVGSFCFFETLVVCLTVRKW